MLEIKSKYKTIIFTGTELCGVTGWFQAETLDIIGCKIIQVDSDSTSSFGLMANSLTGAIIAGAAGVLIMSLANRKKVVLDCDIFLADGSIIQMKTNRKDIIKYLMRFIQTKGGENKRW